MSTDSVTSSLGARLRQHRLELGRTLADVAAAAGVSAGYLAAIESGRNVPSLRVLSRITHSMDLSLSGLLRSADRGRVSQGHIDDEPGLRDLSHPDLRLQVRSLVCLPGEQGHSPFDEAGRPTVVQVISGALRVAVNGQGYDLLGGDALHATRADSLAWETIGEERCVALWTSVAPEVRNANGN